MKPATTILRHLPTPSHDGLPFGGTYAHSGASCIRYEHPLNERIRTFMRLEALFKRVYHFSAGSEPVDHYGALVSLVELRAIAARSDLKASVLRELRHLARTVALRRSKDDALVSLHEPLLDDIDRAANGLRHPAWDFAQNTPAGSWFGGLERRMTRSGAPCEFDFPQLRYWFNGDCSSRRADLNAWIKPFEVIYDGLALVLRQLRGGQRSIRHSTSTGALRIVLPSSPPPTLACITLAKEIPSIPRVSTGRYELNIRLESASTVGRASIYNNRVDFDLMLC